MNTNTDLAAHIEAFTVAEKDLANLVDETGKFISLQDYRSLMERHQRATKAIRMSEAYVAWHPQTVACGLQTIRMFVATQTGVPYETAAPSRTQNAGFFIELKKLIPVIEQLAYMRSRYHSFRLQWENDRFGWSGYMNGDRFEKSIDGSKLSQETLLDILSGFAKEG